MQELEEIVEALESGNLPLETAFEKFETGIKLSRLLNEKLDNTQKKITLLMEGRERDFQQEKETDV